MNRLSTIVLCLALLFAPMTLVAQGAELNETQQQQLVKLIEAGKQAYDRGEFQESLEKFREAYDLYAHPDIVYRIALCHERLGEDQEAVKFYRQFLAENPDASERPRVEKTIEVIEARIAKSEIQITTEPTGAAVFINDESNGAAGTTPTQLTVPPGNYKLIVKKDGFEPVRQLVNVAPGQSVQVRYQLSATKQTDERRKNPDRKGAAPSVKFLTLTTIGVAAGITSVVFFGLHNERRGKLEELDALPRQEVNRVRYEELDRQKNTNLIVAVSSAAVSGFALIWAYGTWVADRNAARAASGPTVGWSAGPVVGYSWRF
jgi:hypothetical protein